MPTCRMSVCIGSNGTVASAGLTACWIGTETAIGVALLGKGRIVSSPAGASRPFCASAADAPDKNRPRPTRLAAIGFSILPAAVVGCFLRNENVMRMALLHRSARHQDEPGTGAQLLDRPAAA